ncbi:MAG: arsenosugar biosynthesis radical SAM (seleno)protein ArsS [bacterium]
MKNHFEEKIAQVMGEGLYSHNIEVLQVNLGLRCNQACAHCHVDASPDRRETMEWAAMEHVIDVARSVQPEMVDLTGGAPELNPHFKRFITALGSEGHDIQVRTNLSVMVEPGMEELPEFLREHRVALFGSMPCYLEENVRAQRGGGVYEKSVQAIRRLNDMGYGSNSGPMLNLVYNPGGAFLPPDQIQLEADYRRELGHRFGIVFTRLLTITNMPVGRFLAQLRKTHEELKYISLLSEAFNPNTLQGLMCRHQISIGWDGGVFDCDFNLALRKPVNHGAPDHIDYFDQSALEKRRVVTGDHCFGCTAGSGSSCRGALA